MPSLGIKINKASIEAKVKKGAMKKGLPVARRIAYNLFKRSHNALLREFDQHPVTLELQAGKNAVPMTDATDGYGNLYSYLGFEMNPIPDLKNLLIQGFSYRHTVTRDLAFYFKVSVPSKEVIAFVTPLPWGTAASWVDSVEKGLDNLAFYMYKKRQGRSKSGFQAPHEINDDLTFKKQDYLSEIIKNFRDRINNSSVNDA